jgi:hypothetical protein
MQNIAQKFKIIDIPEYLLTEIKPKYFKSNSNKPKYQKLIEIIKPAELKPKLIFQYTDSYIIELLDKLPDKYLNNYSEWSKITNILKSIDKFDMWNH